MSFSLIFLLISLILIPLTSSSAIPIPGWMRLDKQITQEEAKKLHEKQAPDAWDQGSPGFLIRVKLEDGTDLPGTWVPTKDFFAVTYTWGGGKVTTREITKYKVQYLKREAPSVGWTLMVGDYRQIRGSVDNGEMTGKGRVLPCRAFQDDSTNRLIIGRVARNNKGCLIYDNSGKEVLKTIYEVAHIDILGESFQDGHTNIGVGNQH